MNENRILDKIKTYKISFKPGTAVQIFRRKINGYPKHIEDDKIYYVHHVEADNKLHLVEDKKYLSIAYPKTKKIHKYYMIPVDILRDEKLNDLFNED